MLNIKSYYKEISLMPLENLIVKFRNSFCLLAFVFLASLCSAQEVQLTLIVDDTQYKLSDKSIFVAMKSDLENFVNSRKWTTDEYDAAERLQMSVQLTITAGSTQNQFYCNAQIQCARPVYGSVYETTVLNFADRDFQFNYIAGMPIEFNENGFSSEITSLLGYFTYIALGMDYDSFSLNGGKDFYQKAFLTLNSNPNSLKLEGWSSAVNNFSSRYWLLENLMNPQYASFHKQLYEYHRLGLDVLVTKPVVCQEKMLTTLASLNELRIINTNSVLISSFILAKRDEYINVMKEAEPTMKKKSFDLLKSLDPAYSTNYQKIID
jgi:Domain of unknown function (DUF4835)